MAASPLKQAKVFTTVRMVGGIAASIVLGFSTVSNMLAGQPLRGPVLMVAVFTLVALAYSAFYAWKLGELVKQQDSE